MQVIGAIAAFNDDRTIGRAVESLWPHVDRVILVDGARQSYPLLPGESFVSTDRTVEIAQRAGAEIIQPEAGPWASEVDQRNAYLVGDPGDWYLILDSDEYLTGTMPPRAILQGEGVDSYLVPIVDDQEPSLVPVKRGRLFRGGDWTLYRYTHFAIYRDGELMRPTIHWNSLVVHHDPDRSDERNRLRLAEKQNTTSRERAYARAGKLPRTTRRGEVMDKIAYLYRSNGAWVPGIPARDLTEAEAHEYGEALSLHLMTPDPIYEPVPQNVSEAVSGPETAIQEPGDDQPGDDQPGRNRKRKTQA